MNTALLAELQRPDTLKDSEKTLKLLAQVRELISSNCMDLEECYPLINLTQTNNAQVKSEVWDLLVRFAARNPDMGVMYVCSLTKDLTDPNPAIRCTAISSLCSLNCKELDAYQVPALVTGFGDGIPTVRVSAVTGVGKLWIHSPATVKDNGLIDRLYGMLRDQDPTVVTFSLQTLTFLLKEEGGLVMNRKMISYLLDRVRSYPDREFCCVIEHFNTDIRETETVLDIFNALDPVLDSRNGGLVLSVAKLLSKLSENHPNLQSSLVDRLCPVLMKFLKTAKRDFQLDLLEFLLGLNTAYFDMLASAQTRTAPVVLLKQKDSEQLKLTKIRFFTKIARAEDCQESLNYLLNQLPSSGPRLNTALVQAAATVSRLDSVVHENCLKNFQLLVLADRKVYLGPILESDLDLDPVLQSRPEVVRSLVAALLDSFQPHQRHSALVLGSILDLLCSYGHLHKLSPYVLEDIFNNREDWRNEEYSKALATGYSLFFQFPASMQPILSNIFHATSKVRNHALQLQLGTYYNLLKQKASKG